MRNKDRGRQQGEAAPPPFDYPWQAQAFALAVSLQESGHFTRAEWSDALGRAIARDEVCNGPDATGTHYYDCWLAALEDLLQAKGLAAPDALQRRRREWEDAYLSTPHGRPVDLRRTAK